MASSQTLTRYVARRILLLLVALVAVSLVIFLAIRVLPGDVAVVMAGTDASPAQVSALRAQLGLDEPLWRQYVAWIGGVLQGDFGTALVSGQSVAAIVADRASITFPLILAGLVIALALGVPLGCAAAVTTRKRARGIYQAVSIVGGAVPALWAGLLLIMLFGRGTGLVGVFPTQGFPQNGWHSFGAAMLSLVLPAVTVGIVVGASMMRYTRSSLIEVASSDVIAMAMACGMTRTSAMIRVGLRLALPQLVSVIGLTFAGMITGVMVIENLFALPGIGTGLVTDIGNRDLVAVQSELLMLAALFLLIGIVVDVLHKVLDPRLGEDHD